jgi:hypothetical protein
MKPIPKFTSGMFKKKVKRYGAASPKKFQAGGSTDDLIPRGMLPDKSVIPEWRQFGYGAEDAKKKSPKKPESKKAPKKMASGGSIDGCAKRGKTRGKYV